MSSSLEQVLATADPEQVAMMEERVILLDTSDNVIGHASKKESHLNTSIESGMLHRAFSVFLFTPDNKLILQKRSADKITFPAFWANTCCSHPLYRPAELEARDQLGVKNAAVRKLQQELGIPPEDVPLESFTFLTRVHYKANGGSADGIWGEHEIDYILICRPGRPVRMTPNTNEVAEVRSFDRDELRTWVQTAESRGDLISPWFRIIEETLLHKWWDAMDTDTLESLADTKIHKAEELLKDHPHLLHLAGFDAPTPAATGRPAGGSPTAETPVARKQGAYGKVKTHSHSLLTQLLHGSEVVAALRFKLGLSAAAKVNKLGAGASESEKWCEVKLSQVSRSFAMVIQQLPSSLRTAVCNFYLVLRGLDTVEDDMENFADNSIKVGHLRAFASYLNDLTWSLDGIGEGHERELLQSFHHVSSVFQSLPTEQRAVIADITTRMGDGMALFSSRNLTQGTEDVTDYSLYCHFVAGLVGEGLSRLFAAAGYEDSSLADQISLANHMGLFLQKTNIIRDYLEDFVEGRAFWPKSIWQEYGSDLGDFANAPSHKALNCLNHLIADAMTHVPACLRYLNLLNDRSVFRFCAIPQVMAIATLDELASNPLVFTGVVKIRKGLAVKLISDASDTDAVYEVFLHHTRSIYNKLRTVSPTATEIATPYVQQVESICLAALPHKSIRNIFNFRYVLFMAVALTFTIRWLHGRSSRWGSRSMPRINDSLDVFGVCIAVFCCAYLVAFTGVPLVMWVTRSGDDTEHLVESAFKLAGVTDESEFVEARKRVGQLSWPEREQAARSKLPAITPVAPSLPVASGVSATGLRQRK